MDSPFFIPVLAVLVIMILTGMIAVLVSGGKTSKKKRMMAVMKGVQAEDQKKANPQDIRREALSRKLKEATNEEEKEKKGNSISDSIMLAGLDISVKQYWLFSFLFAIVLVGLIALSGKGPFVVAMTGIISFFGIPKLVLKRLAIRRQKLFLLDLADVLESMVRLLKAGMPVSEAIKMVAREYPGPIGEEMGRIYDQQKIGVSLPDAVLSCARRMPLAEVQMFATAVAIQSQTGSSLSEVFENLAKVVRARFRLKRKVQALSSEAKVSAAIIAALPVFVASAMFFLNRDYVMILFETGSGNILLAGAIFWMFLGIVIMRQMINFRF